MRRAHVVRLIVALLFLFGVPRNAESRGLTKEERVRAQEAIERVYYGHQTGATRPFEEAVPREFLESKVTRYLKLSVALERFWRTPITSAALQAELERMARQTRYPDRLLEIYRALGNDPTLIKECLARPALVERLARNFFEFDQRIQGTARAQAEDLATRLRSGQLSAGASHPLGRIQEIRRAEDRAPQPPGAGTPMRPGSGDVESIDLAPDEFDRWRKLAPERVGDIGPLVEQSEAFVLRVVLDERADRARIATYAVAKISWDRWWEATSADLDAREVSSQEADPSPLPLPRTARVSDVGGHELSAPCDTDDTWDNGSLDDFPGGLFNLTSVWTGSLMLVWGQGIGRPFAYGGRYDPLTDTWTDISQVNAPLYTGHVAIWTGSAMIVWGGCCVSNAYLNTGARYDPISDAWTPISTDGAPAARSEALAVWTGSTMVVWGGHNAASLNTGGRYDPATDQWLGMSMVGVPVPRSATAIWTGGSMVVWGGGSANGLLNDGARYDPIADAWAPISAAGAPEARSQHTAIWTGSRMIVWGGRGATTELLTGGRYDPATDTWAATSTVNSPSGRVRMTSVWTGNRMLIWGGQNTQNSYLNTGGRYDPVSDSWAPITTVNAPPERTSHGAIWTGSQMIIWGGSGPFRSPMVGGRYDPVADSWTPTAVGSAPSPRNWHAAVWTGNIMVVWGGFDDTVSFPPVSLRSGGRYDPVTDAWTPTSTIGAPQGAAVQPAIWTGDVMLVPSVAARYNPILDRWARIAPGPLGDTAVWTGNRMITWGGQSGGQYDPKTDRWTPISSLNAPVNISYHTSVWTGRVMVVWGGYSGHLENTGGRYDPATDLWTPTSTVNAPAGRRNHTMVWTGSRVMVWGGWGGDGLELGDGGLYDPVTDTWTTVSTVNAPFNGSFATAVWTGNVVLVWGGQTNPVRLGGRYSPSLNSWGPMAALSAPSTRYYHTAVWTGSFMIIWGGNASYSTGGRYALGHAIDQDGDGFTECDGDCNDGDPGVHPGAAELCDGYDNDCDGLSDEDFGDADGDGMGDACDCAPNGPSSEEAPGEVRDDVWLANGTDLSWTSPSGNSGPYTVYDVARGRVGDWPVGSGSSGICLELDSVDTLSQDLETPAPGSAFYYLIRGKNACALGSYGKSSSGAERVTLSCP